MNKMEVFEKMMNSENGGLYAAIAGITIAFGIDRITKSHYKVEASKESVTVAPAADQVKEQAPENPEKAQ